MTDLISEEDVWNRARPVIAKWLRGELTEVDAWFLLSIFEDIQNPERNPLSLPAAGRLARIRKLQVKSKDSLAILALHMRKNVQTIRRWCEAGLVPGAYRTSGGHWRVKITANTAPELLRRVRGFARRPKSLFHSARWIAFKKRMLPVFADSVPLMFRLDADLRGVVSNELPNLKSPVPTEKTLKVLLQMHERGGKPASEYVNLRLAARRRFLKGLPVTAEMLALTMGISRRTLFRRFSRHRIRDVINHAHQPLEPGERENDHETDHEYIADLTMTHEIPAAPKSKAFGERMDSRSSRHH